MSATNRGAKRRPHDNYPTPAWATEWFLRSTLFSGAETWIEPACGEGAILRVVHDYLDNPFTRPKALYASDIRNQCVHASDRSGAMWLPGPIAKLGGHYDIAITNPPFHLALDFAQWGVAHAHYTALLLRLNFLAGQERSEWMASHVPDVHVLAKRPSFAISLSCSRKKKNCTFARMLLPSAKRPTKCPKCAAPLRVSSSDASEYAWFVWYQGERRKGIVRVLTGTPEDEVMVYGMHDAVLIRGSLTV